MNDARQNKKRAIRQGTLPAEECDGDEGEGGLQKGMKWSSSSKKKKKKKKKEMD